MRIKCFFLSIILAAFVFSHCSGHHTNKPNTGPVTPAKEAETAEPTQPAEEKEPPEESKEVVPAIVIKAEEIKEAAPIAAAAPVAPAAPSPDANTITDHIAEGINGVFKEFGYSGDMNIPESFKNRVAHYIRYFSFDEKGSRFFQRGLSRADQYLPMIRQVFQDKNLPLSLVYLPLVESGFNPKARSRAGAVGMWQFMRGTARIYGLHVSRRVDERKDPEKATAAAAEYLNDLLAMFGMEDPFLGICAYNAGEGKILNALRKISYKERSFWTLVNKNLLHTETDEYIPRLLAVILMSRDPETYAAASKIVSVEPDDRVDQEIIDSIHTAPPTPDEENGVESEPGPESEPGTGVNVETGTGTGTGTGPVWIYTVKQGDTLFGVAKKYNVEVDALKEWNQLDSNLIHPDQELKFYTAAPAASRPAPAPSYVSPAPVDKKGYKLIYTVNYGDSLARIALLFKGVSARDIMNWNRLNRTRIYLKQELEIYLPRPPRKVAAHLVKNGDTAAKIAREYGQRIEYVLSLNGMVTDSPLAPGKQLLIYHF
ncbi:MAG: LysM peptidoglycan-binding domain-containing protein [Candidatus Aminicenantes bacterium]|nr:LysM peptidoglycan-binding domain-containing protein [Candidatus Aminicenantes bacterium]